MSDPAFSLCPLYRYSEPVLLIDFLGESAAEETAIGLKIGEEDQRLENEKVFVKLNLFVKDDPFLKFHTRLNLEFKKLPKIFSSNG
jgi:hypothetical protein